MKKCVFAGTFDPFTNGHADTVRNALKLFDEVVVAVAENKRKQSMFSVEERREMISAVYRQEPRVRVVVWGGVMADLLKREETLFYVRGVRNAADFEYETADFYATRDLDAEIVVLYIPAEQSNLHVSSTLVRNCIYFGKPFSGYVPQAVHAYITEKGKHVSETD